MSGSPTAAIIALLLVADAPLAPAGSFQDAASQGDVARITQLIASGADLDERDRIGTPLHHAAARGQATVVALLLEAGADPNALTRHGATALHRAAYRGDRASAELLLAAGADPGIESIVDGTPLHLAAMGGHADLITLLLERGADVNPQLTIANGNCPLHGAASEGQLEAARMLIEAGADVDCVNESTDTPLSIAACRGREAVAALLLASGADVNRASTDRLTALHNAVAQRDVDLARMLLEAGADVAVRSARKGSEKGTPLEIARRVGSEEIAGPADPARRQPVAGRQGIMGDQHVRAICSDYRALSAGGRRIGCASGAAARCRHEGRRRAGRSADRGW
jgi:ankyrin repeat protein